MAHAEKPLVVPVAGDLWIDPERPDEVILVDSVDWEGQVTHRVVYQTDKETDPKYELKCAFRELPFTCLLGHFNEKYQDTGTNVADLLVWPVNQFANALSKGEQ